LIPFDTAPDSAAVPYDDNPDDPMFQTYDKLASLAMFGTIPDSARESRETGQITWKGNPVSMNEAPVFLGRLLQYYILDSLDDLQHNSLTTYVGRPATAKAGIEPPDAELYPDGQLSHMLADNKFYKPFLYKPNFGVSRMKLPKGTAVKFMEEGKPPERFIVQFDRPKYFNVQFVVETFVGTGVGNVPKDFHTSHLATTMQWTFFVTMHYSIEHHPEDNTFVPEIYARWLDALYDGLANKLSPP
jgi:hypothetical protein